MVILRAVGAMVTGIVFWIAIYKLFAPYLSILVDPPLNRPTGWELWMWAFIGVACSVSHMFLIRRVGVSIPAHRQRSTWIRRLLIAIGAVLFLAGPVGIIAILFPAWVQLFGFYYPPWSATEAMIWISLLIFVGIVNKGLAPAMVASILPEADKRVQDDSRAPVIYLRSFDMELSSATTESRIRSGFLRFIRGPTQAIEGDHGIQTTGSHLSPQRMALTALSGRNPLDAQGSFAVVMNSVGPYIAIGRPEEGINGVDIGASKKYVSDHEWQDVVRKWVEMAAVIVLEVGPTKGVAWELSYVMQNAQKIRVLLVLPWSDEDYFQFRTKNASVFTVELPRQRPASRLLTFDSEGQPLTLSPSTTLNATVQPFFERLGLVQPELSFKISGDLQPFIKHRVVQCEHFGVSAYIESLVRADQLYQSEK